MPTYTTNGDSYSGTLPASGGQMTVIADEYVSETLTDTQSTNGKFNPGDSASWSLATGYTDTIKGEFTYQGHNYPVFYDSDSGFYIVMGLDASVTGTFNAVAVACFVRGTAIETATGPAHVEDLRIGDLVVTASGQHRPVKWIGRRAYAGRFLAANPAVQPVRFRAGSLGDGLPRRDLIVSPEHAMFLDGVLIPARCLVNGVTITTEHGRERVEYFHVELDSHDVIMAEGAWSESFLDDNSRNAFQNAHEFGVLYPNAPPPGAFCARRVESGPEVDATRRRLEGTAVQDVRVDRAGVHEIAIRPGASAVRLTTEPFFAPGDRRRLGAAVTRLVLDGNEIALDHPGLAAGWHAREGAWRWTDGAALIQVEGAASLAVEVADLPSRLAA